MNVLFFLFVCSFRLSSKKLTAMHRREIFSYGFSVSVPYLTIFTKNGGFNVSIGQHTYIQTHRISCSFLLTQGKNNEKLVAFNIHLLILAYARAFVQRTASLWTKTAES